MKKKSWWELKKIKYRFIRQTLGLPWMIFDILVDIITHVGMAGAAVWAIWFVWFR